MELNDNALHIIEITVNAMHLEDDTAVTIDREIFNNLIKRARIANYYEAERKERFDKAATEIAKQIGQSFNNPSYDRSKHHND